MYGYSILYRPLKVNHTLTVLGSHHVDGAEHVAHNIQRGILDG